MSKRSNDVLRIQKALIREGYPIKADGLAGPQTEKALLDYELRTKLFPRGIDVSFWNAEVNWFKVASSGVAFAYCKAVDGTHTDPKFAQNWKGIKDAGLWRGAYCWFHPSIDLERQAQAVYRCVGRLSAGDLGLWLDVERDDKGQDKILGTKDDIKPTDPQVEQFAARVAELTGKRPFIYSYSYYLDDRDLEIVNAGLAIADYRPGPPTLPPGWSKHAFHQYQGDTGRQEGVNGPCDLVRFNGTAEELRALAYYSQV